MHYPPSAPQLAWQQAEFGLFCHFGINTFYGKEWSNGSLSPTGFNPTAFDADQWAETARHAGMTYLILTAKHHDGFCLWPTRTTDYSVKSSPWRGGKGDVVKEVAAACRRSGIKLGLYLSPWDRHEPCYSDAKAYDAFYCRQLEELCTGYGELFELWFDGAGSEGRVYDWRRIMDVAHSCQPRAMIFSMGDPSIRWVGNEDGLASDPVNYVAAPGRESVFADLPQDEAVAARYLPPECDVAIRRDWFWQPDNIHTLKSTEHLLGIYYRSVGLGANLLLNLSPNREGLLDEYDCARLAEVRKELDRRFASPIDAAITAIKPGKVELDFQSPVSLDHLVLQEDISGGQIIHDFSATDSESGRLLCSGKTIGHKRILTFARTQLRKLRLEWLEPGGRLVKAQGFLTGHETLPELGAHLDYADWAAKADMPSNIVPGMAVTP